jgi:HPt (histidine-containing phosphotransfer) domain-containing protein
MAMTQQQAVDQLNKTNETLVKVSNETDSLLTEIEKLKQELANAGGAGGTITPELEAAITAVDTRAHAIDQLVEDVPQPESSKK